MLACIHATLLKLCLTLCEPMDCSSPGFSVHRILQAGILEWVAIPFSRGSSQCKNRTRVSCTGRWILYHWAQWKAPSVFGTCLINTLVISLIISLLLVYCWCLSVFRFHTWVTTQKFIILLLLLFCMFVFLFFDMDLLKKSIKLNFLWN